jgi:hypothetical protein
MGGVNDGQMFIEDSRLGQSHVVRSRAVTSFTAHTGFGKGVFLNVHTRGVTTAATLAPGPLVPAVLFVSEPLTRPGVVLNRSHVESPLLFHQKSLLPLHPDGVFYLLDFGDIKLIRWHVLLLQVGPNELRIDLHDQGIPDFGHILKGAAVESRGPGIVVLQVAEFASPRAHVGLGLGQYFLDFGLIFIWAAARQPHSQEPYQGKSDPSTRFHLLLHFVDFIQFMP